MAEDLQGKIDVLEKKGIENLTDDEFENLDKLQDKLLAVSKAKNAELDKIIAESDARIEKNLQDIQKQFSRIETNLKQKNSK